MLKEKLRSRKSITFMDGLERNKVFTDYRKEGGKARETEVTPNRAKSKQQ